MIEQQDTSSNGSKSPKVTEGSQLDDEITMWNVLDALRKRILLIISLGAGCGAVAAIVGILMAPVYQAQVIALPTSDDSLQTTGVALQSRLGGLAALAGLDVAGGAALKTKAIATIRSQLFVTEFIDRHGLMPILFPSEYTAALDRVSENGEYPTHNDAYALWTEEVFSLSEDARSGLLTVTIQWTDPKQAASWANLVVADANRVLRKRAIDDANRNLAFLERQLEQTIAVDLRLALFQLVETETRKAMLANVKEDYAFQVIDPATVPDGDQFVRPKPVLWATSSALVGIFITLLAISFREFIRRERLISEQRARLRSSI